MLHYRGDHVHREEANDVPREERHRHAVPRNGGQGAPLEEDDEQKGEDGAAQSDHSEEFFLRRVRERERGLPSRCA